MSKCLTFKSDDANASKRNLCPYLFDDDKPLQISSEKITVGDLSSPDFHIGDKTDQNSTLYENVTAPEDWAGCKYTFDGTTWTAVDGYVDPKEQRIAELQAQIDALKA